MAREFIPAGRGPDATIEPLWTQRPTVGPGRQEHEHRPDGQCVTERATHLRSSSAASIPPANGSMKHQTSSPIGAVPKTACPAGV